MTETRSSINFESDCSVAEFTVPNQAYFANHPDAPFDLISTCSLVLDTTSPSEPRVLLLQRAATDSNPNKWEPPGGACDDEDASILHGAARELREEAGLEAVRVSGPVGDPVHFTLRSGKRVCQFTFAVQVKAPGGTPTIRLDPKEHQNFVWATEREIQMKGTDDMHLDFTSDDTQRKVLAVFGHHRKKNEAQKSVS